MAEGDHTRTVMLFGAHSNDEFALAATLAAHVRAGDAVWAAWFARDDREKVDKLRQEEAFEAMRRIGVQRDCLIFADLPPFALVEQLPALVDAIRELVEHLKPDLIYCPAYEGGHPDHDALNFATYEGAALEGVECREYPMYRRAGTRRFLRRLPRFARLLPGSEPDLRWLDPKEVAFKRELWKVYKSQHPLMDWLVRLSGDELRFFSTEQTRPLPLRDYRRPPHERPLLYENQPEGVPFSFEEFADKVRRYEWSGGIDDENI